MAALSQQYLHLILPLIEKPFHGSTFDLSKEQEVGQKNSALLSGVGAAMSA
jgi:hypothetical protein